MSKVIKLAQPGYDVKTAGDQNLIYNSNWPMLKIHKQGSFQADGAGSVYTVASHDLGYVPVHCTFNNQTINGYYTPTNLQVAERSDYNATFSFPVINESDFKFRQFVASTGTIKFYWYIFAHDLTQPYLAPSFDVGSNTGGGARDKVFKIVKPGRDINSSRLEDFVIHSKARSPMIHAVSPGRATFRADLGGYFYGFRHNLGYTPIAFFYEKCRPGLGFPEPLGWFQSFTGTSAFISSTSCQILLPYETDVGIVVLKDPFTLDYSAKVSV